MRASSSRGSYGNYANVWCKNETDSLIKTGIVKFIGTGTIYKQNVIFETSKKFFIKEGLQFCNQNRMKLWYPSQPFENVSIDERKLIGPTSTNSEMSHSWLFWSSLKRKNTTHFETPINEIVLQDWIKMGSAEKSYVPK